MATRYRIGHHRATRSFHIKGVLFITLLVIGLVALLMYFLGKEQFTATQPQSSVTEVVNPSGENKQFDETYFSLNLPEDWKLESSQQAPTIHYVFRSMKRFADNRTLTIYVDTVRPDFALSHLLPVEANGDRVTIGNMSDRCSNFAGNDSTSKQNVAAKWNGVNFVCGMSYINDYIVGTSSAASGTNKVELAGPTTGKHVFFFVYNDQNISPDAVIFQEALRSFRAK